MTPLKMSRTFRTVLISIVIVLAVVFVGYEIHHHAASTSDTAQKASTLDGQIAIFQAAIKNDPQNVKSYISLSEAYIQKVRETSDATYYAKIDDVLTQAEKVDPTNTDVESLRASVALGRHQFSTARDIIQKVLATSTHNPTYYGILGDADIELGKYDEVVDSFQKMADIRPDFSSYSRIAYIRELYGDVPGALDALRQAIVSGSSYAENIAWAYNEEGKLDFRSNLPEAKIDFNNALTVLPNYPYAYEGLGKIAYAEGSSTEAINYFTQALDQRAIAQFAIDIGDVYAADGNKDKAAQYYTLAEISYQTSDKSGVDNDLEEGLFLADHDMNLPQALAMTQRAYTNRPSVYGANALMWAEYKTGDFADAAKLIPEVMRLGQNDPLLVYYAAMVSFKNGDTEQGNAYLKKALSLSPYFSILYSASAAQMYENQ